MGMVRNAPLAESPPRLPPPRDAPLTRATPAHRSGQPGCPHHDSGTTPLAHERDARALAGRTVPLFPFQPLTHPPGCTEVRPTPSSHRPGPSAELRAAP